MQFKIIFSIGFTGLTVYCIDMPLFFQLHTQENTSPDVTISMPTKNGKFQWNSIVPYSISVSDQEDGNSEYNEIPRNEVLLMVKYLPDSSHVQKYLLDRLKVNNQPLLQMSTSTCFDCHAAKSKLIGPSFELIASRYSSDPIPTESLARKIITGTSSTWGDVKMPPNPNLKIEQAREMVNWILKNSLDPDQNYFAGMEGAFRTQEEPDKETGKEVYVLIASYADHGVNNMPGSSKQGEHTVALKNILNN